MKHSRILAVGASAAAALSLALGSSPAIAAAGGNGNKAKGRSGTAVSVRVEGMAKTLLSQSAVLVRPAAIDKDGNPADVCEGASGAVALQDATKGDWTAGPFSSGLGYPVFGILGESYPFSSSYYWSMWIDGKPASTGVCAPVHAKERLLFFPQCAQESASACPQGMFDPAVLLIRGATHVRVGHPLSLSVFSLADLTGKSTPAKAAKLTAAGKSTSTGPSGKAKLRFAKAGTYQVVATAGESVRDELTVRVTR